MSQPNWVAEISKELAACQRHRLEDANTALDVENKLRLHIRDLEAAIREAKLAIACGGSYTVVIDRVTAALDSTAQRSGVDNG